MQELSRSDCAYISAGTQSKLQDNMENTIICGTMIAGLIAGFSRQSENPCSTTGNTIVGGLIAGVCTKIVTWSLIKVYNFLAN